MNKQKFDKVVKRLTEDRKEVSKGKREDYTGGSDNVLQNFYNQADKLGLTPMQSLAVHMEKQISAVFNYIKTNGQSESEPIIKRIGDSINYLELLWGLINEEQPWSHSEFHEKHENGLKGIDSAFNVVEGFEELKLCNEHHQINCTFPNCDCSTERSS
ncbi:MAG TPA: hypothetical protein VLA13_04555, partial [Massilibacterium sp.]|nr:hypothetical protein [Massilibacterium sp.]